MKYILKYVKKYYPMVALSLVLLVAQAFCSLMLPNLMSDIVNVGIQEYSQQILAQPDMAQSAALQSAQRDYILLMGLKMLALALVTTVVALGVNFTNARMGAGIAKDLRKAVFTKIEGFSSQEFDTFSTSSLITRTTNDIQQVQQLFTMGIRMLFFAPLMAVGAIFMAVSKAPSMIWINALTVVLVLGMMAITFALLMSKFGIMQALVDKLNLTARESLSGMMVVRAFSKQKYEEQRFDKVNREYSKTNLYVNKVMSVMMPTMDLVQYLIPVLIIIVGAGRIATSELKVGDMMAFIQYSATIMQAFAMISMIFIMFPRAKVSIGRIGEVFDMEYAIKERENPVKLEGDRCTIEFKDVDFSYPNSEEKVLENINFTVNPGQTTAIIGSTGCGKTSLVNLITRLYEVTSGEVRVNGINVKDLDLNQLRSYVGYVPQKSLLFSGTIDSNLRIGKQDATDAEIKTASEIAQADGFISEKENGYLSEISQGGTNVSGGQKQRLAIARAIAKKAPIYVFDDSFSALDFKTDANLRRALKEKLSQASIIIVGQRVASIMDADQIIVMDEGKIVGIGRHKELLQNCEQYKEIAHSQLQAEEM
ncbi:MAG: ABC transporter ATP-binding protein [Oscillospiraceae bacterium]